MKYYKHFNFSIFYTFGVLFCILSSCDKQHLNPDVPEGMNEPVVYVTAFLNSDSVYFGGGVESYAAITSVTDTLSHRTFNFLLQNTINPHHSYFAISINNYTTSPGILQDDLDSSIFESTRHYQYFLSGFNLLDVTVTWFDSSGIEFSSGNIHQTNLFFITNVEEIIFEDKLYKKATVEFECTLSSDNDIIIHLTNDKATILFSIN